MPSMENRQSDRDRHEAGPSAQGDNGDNGDKGKKGDTQGEAMKESSLPGGFREDAMKDLAPESRVSASDHNNSPREGLADRDEPATKQAEQPSDRKQE